ncbi:MAG: hypothetical protein J0M04_12135 [Verrucomicrobia bacterium]|nr:hypothetical protein [Verrucomicrobiota bacterium]
MKPDDWIRDPVFQLNLLVWMSKEQPEEAYCVRPVFHAAGFEWMAIEQPFRFPVETAKRIEQINETEDFRIHPHPEPELVLKRSRDHSALYFEAKKNSFGVASSASSQARGHLVAVGPAFAEVNAPLERALLIYLVPDETTDAMRACLSELTDQLRTASLDPGDSAVDGLSASGTAIHYHLDYASRDALEIKVPRIAIMENLAEATDPSPLLLVYSDEDCPVDERRGYYRRVIQNQAIATLLCELHRVNVGESITLTAARILEITTQGAFGFLGSERRKKMELLLKINVFNKIAEYWKSRSPEAVKVQGKELTVSFPSDTLQADFLDWLERSKAVFRDEAPKGPDSEQMDLPLE